MLRMTRVLIAIAAISTWGALGTGGLIGAIPLQEEDPDSAQCGSGDCICKASGTDCSCSSGGGSCSADCEEGGGPTTCEPKVE